ncbi:hypothetical protein [Levilactobacillus lindianensis]|uniref:hypothetical protein n=1 Tax=Levilactobacillus lindianensis TaxID=2486018 RepID=UPI000F74BE01|nr:hypothetical protein [Levilactobacillus lindianensis]
MSANSRMARYHSEEAENPQPQASPNQNGYQRRPALARWVAVLIMLLTITVGLRFTVFNANYTAGVISRDSTGQKVVNDLNNDLLSLGISGNPVTSGLVQPYLEQGIAEIYGESGATVDDTDLKAAIAAQAQAMGVTASDSLQTSLAKQAQKTVKQAVQTDTMMAAGTKIRRARQLDLWVIVAVAMLLIVTTVYAFSVHHVFGSLGPGLAVGGLLTIILGAVGYFGLPVVLAGMASAVRTAATTVGHSGLGVIIFVGAAEIVLGLLVLLGHRTFRKS